MSDDTPQALLKSALEKIVYFEARSTQLNNDADSSRGELERVKVELASAAQREIELRRVIAELEVRATRAHAEREEMARLVDALRRERAELVGKMLEASRIHGLDQGVEGFDLAQFIAQLRSEVLLQRDGAPTRVGGMAAALEQTSTADTVTGVAHELKAQGRLQVSANDVATLAGALDFPGRSEETLFGFSVRELSALDVSARVRAAERLEALRHPAAAPALATALHSETEAPAQVALLSALASLAKAEAVPVVQPLLTSKAPEVRIAALKALLVLDPAAAGPHLAAATKDPDKAVRRRASLLALGLAGKEAFELGSQTIRDVDADVRALAALVLGASNAEVARPLLLDAMRDPETRVRRAASQSLSRLLGQDVTSLVSLEDAHRRREVRKLTHVPAAKIDLVAVMAAKRQPTRASHSSALETQPQRSAPTFADGREGARHTLATSEVRSRGAHAQATPAGSHGPHSAVGARHVPVPAATSPVDSRGAHSQATPTSNDFDSLTTSDAGSRGAHRTVGALAVSAQAATTDVHSRGAHPLATPTSSDVGSRGAHHSFDSRQGSAQAATSVVEATRMVDARHGSTRASVGGNESHGAPHRVLASSQSMASHGVSPQPATATHRVAVLEVEAPVSAEVTAGVLRELRASIRGRPLAELSANVGAPETETLRACSELLAAGSIVRRGHKYFVA